MIALPLLVPQPDSICLPLTCRTSNRRAWTADGVPISVYLFHAFLLAPCIEYLRSFGSVGWLQRPGRRKGGFEIHRPAYSPPMTNKVAHNETRSLWKQNAMKAQKKVRPKPNSVLLLTPVLCQPSQSRSNKTKRGLPTCFDPLHRTPGEGLRVHDGVFSFLAEFIRRLQRQRRLLPSDMYTPCPRPSYAAAAM